MYESSTRGRGYAEAIILLQNSVFQRYKLEDKLTKCAELDKFVDRRIVFMFVVDILRKQIPDLVKVTRAYS